MQTYTEAQVSALLQSQSKSLNAEIVELKSRLRKEGLLREEAEKKYQKLCESCITAYATHKEITTDTVFIQVSAPRFLTATDFENGVIPHILRSLGIERERAEFDSNILTRNNKEN